MEVLKVSGQSRPGSVAGALAAAVRRDGCVELQAVGAVAVNQAVKAVAVARQFFLAGGQDLVITPAFQDVEIGGSLKTCIRLVVNLRRGAF